MIVHRRASYLGGTMVVVVVEVVVVVVVETVYSGP